MSLLRDLRKVTQYPRPHRPQKEVPFNFFLPGEPNYPFQKPIKNVNAPHGSVHVKNKTIIIQIDGLSHAAFLMALRTNLVPQSLREFLEQRDYEIKPFYCGQESATFASTAGFLYGMSIGVSSSPGVTQDSFERRQPGLLEEGTVYTMFFDGDSDAPSFVHSRFVTMFDRRWSRKQTGKRWIVKRMQELMKRAWLLRPDRFAELVSRVTRSILKSLRQGGEENPRTFKDYRDIVRHALRQACLGEVAATFACHGVQFDIQRGTPVSWVNFVGYDTASHFYGPFAEPALETLRDIFHKIEQVVKTIKQSPETYHLYLLSDHGQVPSKTFRNLYGETFPSVLEKQFGKGTFRLVVSGPHAHLHFKKPVDITTPLSWLLYHPGIGIIAIPKGDEGTLILTKGGSLHVREGKIVEGDLESLRDFGEPEMIAWHIDREASLPTRGDLIFYASFTQTWDGAGFTVDFEDHFGHGSHGSVGGHQGVPFIAHAIHDSIDTTRIMGSWDLHYQLYRNLTGGSP